MAVSAFFFEFLKVLVFKEEVREIDVSTGLQWRLESAEPAASEVTFRENTEGNRVTLFGPYHYDHLWYSRSAARGCYKIGRIFLK